jgi:hypothetical protein
LTWALRHPLAEVRMNAAGVLGRRRETRAVAVLTGLVETTPDAYLAVAALEAPVRIQGVEATRDLLERAAKGSPAPFRPEPLGETRTVERIAATAHSPA